MSEDERSYLPFKERSGPDSLDPGERSYLQSEVRVGPNSLDPAALIGTQKDLLRRHAGLLIEPEWIGAGLYRFRGNHSIRNEIDALEARFVRIDPEELLRKVQECRNVWYMEVVLRGLPERGGAPRRAVGLPPYATDWNLSDSIKEPEFKQIGARLACAGRNLFRFIFFESGNTQLAGIGQMLQHLSREQPMVMTMTSEDIFVPWPLLYTHLGSDKDLKADGMNFDWRGFWGVRHIIEQEYIPMPRPGDSQIPSSGRTRLREARIVPGPGCKVTVGFTADDGIDARFDLTTVADQRRFFAELAGAQTTDRSTREALERAFRRRRFPDQICYFLCHHEGAGPADGLKRRESLLYLRQARQEGDRHAVVKTGDIENWLDGRPFSSPPFVFINGCEGGHMTTVNYETIALLLLKRGAIGLVGPQINLPVVFAAEYARRFFSAFLNPAPGSPPKKVRVGELVRDLAQQFLERHNPLGLVYSLYRGLDCYVDWEKQP